MTIEQLFKVENILLSRGENYLHYETNGVETIKDVLGDIDPITNDFNLFGKYIIVYCTCPTEAEEVTCSLKEAIEDFEYSNDWMLIMTGNEDSLDMALILQVC